MQWPPQIPGRDAAERALEHQRPRPDPGFARRIGAELGRQWALNGRPHNLRSRVLGLITVGLLLLLIALAVAVS
jgi:hypothetical protein